MEVPTANKLNSNNWQASQTATKQRENTNNHREYSLVVVQVEVINLGVVARFDDHRVAGLDKVRDSGDCCGDGDLLRVLLPADATLLGADVQIVLSGKYVGKRECAGFACVLLHGWHVLVRGHQGQGQCIGALANALDAPRKSCSQRRKVDDAD